MEEARRKGDCKGTAACSSPEEKTAKQETPRQPLPFIPELEHHHAATMLTQSPRTVISSFPHHHDCDNEEVPSLTLLAVSTYKKMLRFGVPVAAVQQKMKADGFGSNKAVMEAVFGKNSVDHEANVTLQRETETKTVPHVSATTTRLPWIPLSPEQITDETIWSRHKQEQSAALLTNEKQLEHLKELFERKHVVTSYRRQALGTRSVELTNLVRAGNITVALRAFRELSQDELAQAIAHLVLQPRDNQVHLLRDLVPKSCEVTTVKSYTGSLEELAPASQWLCRILSVRNYAAKMKALETMETFVSEMECLHHHFQLLHEACHQVMDSEKLREVLAFVLEIGNVLNKGARFGDASGFKLSSLSQLTKTKSPVSNMTVLDFIVQHWMVTEKKRQTLLLRNDFPTCFTAGRMILHDLLNNTTSLGNALQTCQEVVKNAKLEREEMVSGSEGELLLFRNGIKHLETFCCSAKEDFSQLEQHRDAALFACRKLSTYFGEHGPEDAISCLQALSVFSKELEDSIERYDAVQKATKWSKQRGGSFTQEEEMLQ
jgi:hypothetical protein